MSATRSCVDARNSYDAESIAKALGGAKKGSKGWWNARCPCHDDRNPSFGIRDTNDGTIAFKCQAGCDSRAIRAELEKRGLLPQKTRARAKKKQPKPLGPIVAVYDYRDEGGKLLFQVTRHDPKDFRQRRPDLNAPGSWRWSLDGVRRVLYRLPELFAADHAELVFLCEGEKDADRLRSLGLVATTTPQGAKSWKLADSAVLTGRHVVMLPDNDPAGETYRQDIEKDLSTRAASVRLLRLPDLPEKGDVSNWLDAGGTKGQLLELAAKAPLAEARPWARDLVLDRYGQPANCVANGAMILRRDPTFAGNVRFDELRRAPVSRNRPWLAGDGWTDWTNLDDTRFAEWCQLRGVPLSPATCAHAVAAAASDNRVHPVVEYLDSLTWDGQPRLDSWLVDFLGVIVPGGNAEEIKAKRLYIEEVGRKFLISAVARAKQPGCKADHALILEGGQGVNKSQTAEALVPDLAWFAEDIADLGTKDSAQDLNGKWIVELPELSSMKRGDVERIKAFLSKKADHYRPSYGRRSQDFPRQTVFIGTTNQDTYLADETGNRRFWPVTVGRMDVEGLRQVRDQLWAEAVHAFNAGEKWWLEPEIERLAAEEQAGRRIDDPWEEIILKWLADRLATCAAASVSFEPTVVEIMRQALDMDTAQLDQASRNRVGRILREHGWQRYRKRIGPSLAWVYRAPACSMSEACSTSAEAETWNKKANVSNDVPHVPHVPPDSETPLRGDPESAEEVAGSPYRATQTAWNNAEHVEHVEHGTGPLGTAGQRITNCASCKSVGPVNEAGLCPSCATAPVGEAATAPRPEVRP